MELHKLPDYSNDSFRYAQITLHPGAMKMQEWQTLCLNPDLGTYAVTATPDHRLVLLPRDGSPMKYLDFSGVIRIERADKESNVLITFEKGLLTRGPSRERDPEE